MSTELKDCPFCGCAATFVKHSAGVQGTRGFDKWDAVACKHCRATVGACDRRFRCRDDAREAWNRRASSAAAVPNALAARQVPLAPDAARVLHDNIDALYIDDSKAAAVPEDALPPLPPRDGDWAGDDWFTADSMRDYARAAVSADKASQEAHRAQRPGDHVDDGKPIYGPEEEEAGRKIEAAGLMDEASTLCEAARRTQARQDDRHIKHYVKLVVEADRAHIAKLQAAYEAATSLAGETIDARNAEITELRAALADRAQQGEPVEIARYDLAHGGRMAPRLDGDWVRYSDHIATKAAQQGEPVDISGLTRWTFDGGLAAAVSNEGQWVSYSDLEVWSRRAATKAAPADAPNEPDWSGSKTLISEMWKNPLLPMGERLQIADGAVRFRNDVIARLRRKLAECAAPVPDTGIPTAGEVPEGWQLVPVEPNMAMVAALAFAGDEMLAIGHAAISQGVIEDYKAMLASAPHPLEAKAGEPGNA